MSTDLEEAVDKIMRKLGFYVSKTHALEITNRVVAAVHLWADKLKADKNTAYAERNTMVAALTNFFPSHLKRHPESDTEWEDDWRNIVCIHGPGGQMTWHIHDSELHIFKQLSVEPVLFADCKYDGHSTDEKYKRLFRSIKILKQAGPQCTD